MQVGVYDKDEQLCQFEGCTEIDLLSASCSHCRRRFCSHHLSHSAHHCPSVTDVRVGACPICQRIVPLEYPRQNVDEAVSRHIDRGCQAIPQGRPLHKSGTTRDRPANANGHRLGGAAPTPCSVEGCLEDLETRVRCDQCSKMFCLHHRGPLSHNCRETVARSTAVLSSSLPSHHGKGVSASLGGGATSVLRLLTHPLNTPETALGKATELPSDMVTCLVCFLIPTAAASARTADVGCEAFEPVPPFFMFAPKRMALGRIVDSAVDRAVTSSRAVRTGTPWKLFAVTLPVHVEAVSAYYPPVPLSALVGQSAVGRAESTILFVTSLTALPECVLEAIRDLDRKGRMPTASSSSSDKNCLIM